MSSDGALKEFLRFGKRCAFKVLPEGAYLKLLYRIRFGRRLDLRNPQAFSEKIYCLKSINGKLFTSLMQRCYDKVDVRGYILEKLGECTRRRKY